MTNRVGLFVVSRYERWLEMYPFRTKALSASFLMGSSDLIAQTLEQRHSDRLCYDPLRTARMLGIGLCSGGLMHFWYGLLNTKVKSLGPRGAITKVAFDQLVFAPISLPVVFFFSGVLLGHDISEIKNTFLTKYVDALTVNYFIWPISMLINFRYVPARYQVLWASTISLGWSVYLSTSANKDKHQVD